jgi:PIN domain nuclease of toxin-antitoxin system
LKQLTLVTDTHPLVWYLLNKHIKLSKKVLEAFRTADNGDIEILVPSAVVWEMMILCKRRRIAPAISFSVWLTDLFKRPGFQMIIAEPEDFVIAKDLTFSSDEFDTMIVSNALRLDANLITNDGLLHEVRPCKLYW